MKKMIILSAVFLTQLWASAQLNTSIPERINNKELGLQFKQESKNLNRAGFILLGAGIASFAIGLSMFNEDLNSTPGLVLGAAGLIMVPASIPCFIIAGSKNRKGRMLLQKEKAPLTYRGNANKGITSLSLAINF